LVDDVLLGSVEACDGPAPAAAGGHSLARLTLAGVGWLLAQTVGARVIGFASQIVLARILVPTDFASFGLAGTITAIVGVLISFGVDDVLLQRQKAMAYWTTPAFLTSLLLGAASMLLVAAAAPFAAAMYRAPVLDSILPIMALSMPLGALSTVPGAILRAKLNFRFLATYATVELTITQVLTILLALKGWGVFSIVLPGPLMAALRAIIFWTVAKPRLRRVRPSQFRLMGFRGGAVFGTKILTALVGQGSYFTLGLLAPKPVVGVYFFAFRLAVQPVLMLAGSLSNVLFPALTQLRSDPERQRQAALNASRILAFVVMPYGFMQAALAGPLLGLVFGAKWQAAIPLVQILSVGLAFDAISWIAGALLSARGEFRRSFIYSCVFSPVFFVVVAIGAVMASAPGVAIAVSAFYIVLAPVYSYAVFSRMGASLREVASIYVSATVQATLAMGLAAWASTLLGGGKIIQGAVILVLGGALYLALIRTFAPSGYRELVSRLTAALPSKHIELAPG
jgi:O-antigen/teichoic acid export membrane protein